MKPVAGQRLNTLSALLLWLLLGEVQFRRSAGTASQGPGRSQRVSTAAEHLRHDADRAETGGGGMTEARRRRTGAGLPDLDLRPSAPLESDVEPLEIQVTAPDWKWLFIYPQPHIAMVNRPVFTAHRPLHCEPSNRSFYSGSFRDRPGFEHRDDRIRIHHNVRSGCGFFLPDHGVSHHHRNGAAETGQSKPEQAGADEPGCRSRRNRDRRMGL